MKKALLLWVPLVVLLICMCFITLGTSPWGLWKQFQFEKNLKPAPSLSDPDVERRLKEAVDFDSLEERDGRGQRGSRLRAGRFYQTNESEPYSGWVKVMYDSGQVRGLSQIKDGREDGLMTEWDENGRFMSEWNCKDGKIVSQNFYHRRNEKGEEVDSSEK